MSREMQRYNFVVANQNNQVLYYKAPATKSLVTPDLFDVQKYALLCIPKKKSN